MMWYWGNGTHWWAMLFGAVVMVAFWGAIIWAIWYFVTGADRRPEQATRTDDAQRILDERLARGEIDAEEYGRLQALLRNDTAEITGNGRQSATTGSGR